MWTLNSARINYAERSRVVMWKVSKSLTVRCVLYVSGLLCRFFAWKNCIKRCVLHTILFHLYTRFICFSERSFLLFYIVKCQYIMLLWQLRSRIYLFIYGNRIFKLHIRKCYYIKKTILSNLCNNFDGIICSEKNSGAVFVKNVWVRLKIKKKIRVL